jgi:type II secretory pathway pseudopilin PulG
MTILAVAGSSLLLGVHSSLQTTVEAQQRTIAMGLARQMLDEISGRLYAEPGAGPYEDKLGPTAWESLGSGRERFNDIDDYNGFQAVPAVDPWGVPLGSDNGDGEERHPAFVSPNIKLSGWKRQTAVYYVDDADPTVRLGSGETSNLREVVVTVRRADSDGAVRTFATTRRVFAYVPTE